MNRILTMEELKESLVDEHFKEFCFERAQRSSIDEKIQMAYEYLKWCDALPKLRPQSSKSATKAAEYREVGNSYFRVQNYIEALRFYTKSVAFAPAQSELLAFAYANRSAALLGLAKYQECLLDINRAFQENYPPALKKKLVDRKKKCIKQFKSAVEFYKIVGQKYLFGKATLEELEESFNPDGMEPPDHLRILPPKIDPQNKIIPNASEKIKIKTMQGNKSGIFATANIKPGEVLATEAPYISVLRETYCLTHCANCFVRTEALIHCPNCSLVIICVRPHKKVPCSRFGVKVKLDKIPYKMIPKLMFCSIRCRENAFEKFHRIECQIFSMLMDPDEEDVSMMTWATVRILLIATKQGQELDQMMSHPVYKFQLKKKCRPNPNEKLQLQDYSSIFYHGQFSCANKFKDFGSELSLNPFLAVAQWMYFLKQTSYFGKEGKNQENMNIPPTKTVYYYDETLEKFKNFEGPLTNRELYAATFLLRAMQNDFRAINEGVDIMSNVDAECEVRPIGHGVFPFVNLLGHSCEPHVAMFSYENNLVCRAVRPIKAGEEIFICYGTPFFRRPKNERILFLQENYNFECKCKPCQLSWPIKKKLLTRFPQVVSDTISTKKFLEYITKFRKLKNALNFQELASTENQEFLCEYLAILDKRFDRPYREFIECVVLLELSLSTAANFYNIICE